MAVEYKCSVPELVHVTARALIIEIQLHRAPLQITYDLIMTLTRSGPEIKPINWTQVAQRGNFNARGSSKQSTGTAVAELVFS